MKIKKNSYLKSTTFEIDKGLALDDKSYKDLVMKQIKNEENSNISHSQEISPIRQSTRLRENMKLGKKKSSIKSEFFQNFFDRIITKKSDQIQENEISIKDPLEILPEQLDKSFYLTSNNTRGSKIKEKKEISSKISGKKLDYHEFDPLKENDKINQFLEEKKYQVESDFNKDTILPNSIKSRDIMKMTITNKPDMINSNTRKIRKFKNIYDSYSEGEYESEEVESKYVIHEKSNFKKFWDILMTILVLYSCTVEPYSLSFSLSKKAQLYEIIIDFLFCVDLILNFFSPIYNEDKIIKSQKKIIKNYLNGWFLADLCSSMPVSLIYFLHSTVFISKFWVIFRWLRVLRIIKLAKNDSIGHVISNMQVINNSSINRIIKFGMVLLLLIHISTCVWVAIGLAKVNQVTWIKYYGLNEQNHSDVYVASAYFNLVTLFTIGYGDITARNSPERIYNIIYMFIGVMLFSFAVSSLSTLFSKISDTQKRLNVKLETLENIRKEFKLHNKFFYKIKKFILTQHTDLTTNNEKFDLLDTLPHALKKEMVIGMLSGHRQNINDIEFFKQNDKDFIIYVVPLMKSLRVFKNDTLIAVGDYVEEMYLVLKGTLSIRMQKFYGNLEIAQIRKNKHFGEIFMYLNENCPYYLNCKTISSELLSLKKEDYTKIKLSFNNIILNILENSCQYLEKVEKAKKVVIELYNHGVQISKIKTKLKKMNKFLLKRNFDSYFMKNLSIEEPEDFILANDLEDIIKFLNSNMMENDFYECFVKDKNLVHSNSSQVENESGINDLNPLNLLTQKLKLKHLKQIHGMEDECSSDESIETFLNSKKNNSLHRKSFEIKLSNVKKTANEFLDKKNPFLSSIDKYNKHNLTDKLGELHHEIHTINKINILHSSDLKDLKNITINKKQNEENKGKLIEIEDPNIITFNKSSINSNNRKLSPLKKYKKVNINEVVDEIKSNLNSEHSDIKENPDDENKLNDNNFKVNKIESNFNKEDRIMNTYNFYTVLNYENNNKNNIKIKRMNSDSSICSVINNNNIENNLSSDSNKFNNKLIMCKVYSYAYHEKIFIETLYNENGSYQKSINTVCGNFMSSIDKDKYNSSTLIRKESNSIIKNIGKSILNKIEIAENNKNTIDFSELNLNENNERKEKVIKNTLKETKFLKNPPKIKTKQFNILAKKIPCKNKMSPTGIINPNSNALYGKLPFPNNPNDILRNIKVDDRNKPSNVISKENLFNKVSSGLQMNELLQSDKFMLMDNINFFLNNYEKKNKKEKQALKKLDRLDKLFVNLKFPNNV